MRYSFHPDAKRELFEAINYYDECKDGLGLEFAKEVYSTIQRIVHLLTIFLTKRSSLD
jgi:hypothetical protein